MEQLRQESDDRAKQQSSWVQLALEFVVFAGIAALLFVTAERIPPARSDAHFALALAVLLHAAGLVRLCLRVADYAEREETP